MANLETAYTFTGLPNICDAALEVYAEEVIREFSPERLAFPGVLNTLGLLTQYLGLNVLYHRIHQEYDRKTLAITVFEDSIIRIVDVTTGKPMPYLFPRGTVIVDIALLQKGSETRQRFCLAHEAAHWLLHQQVFAQDNPLRVKTPFQQQAPGRAIEIHAEGITRRIGDTERMDKQANLMASYLIMPRIPLRKAYKSFFEQQGTVPRRLYRDAGQEEARLISDLTLHVATQFGVSRQAALIRLEKLRAISRRGSWGEGWGQEAGTVNASLSLEPNRFPNQAVPNINEEAYIYNITRHMALDLRMAAFRKERGNSKLRIVLCPHCRRKFMEVPFSMKVSALKTPVGLSATSPFETCSFCHQRVWVKYSFKLTPSRTG